jgi:hypothetical protein
LEGCRGNNGRFSSLGGRFPGTSVQEPVIFGQPLVTSGDAREAFGQSGKFARKLCDVLSTDIAPQREGSMPALPMAFVIKTNRSAGSLDMEKA